MTQARRDFLAQLGAIAALGSGAAVAGIADMAGDSRSAAEAAMAAYAGALARAHGGHSPEPGDSALLDPRLNRLLPTHPDAWEQWAAQHDAVLAAALRQHQRRSRSRAASEHRHGASLTSEVIRHTPVDYR